MAVTCPPAVDFANELAATVVRSPPLIALYLFNRPISVEYHFPCQALTLCPQLCMGIQRGARFPTRSADALPATQYGHFTSAIYRNWPVSRPGRSLSARIRWSSEGSLSW